MRIKKELYSFLLVLIIVFNIHYVSAGLGITPAITNVNFEPNMSFLVNYNVLKADPNTTLVVYADGDFSEYVTFDKTSLIGQDGFTTYVDLPVNATKPGKNRLYIKVKEYNNQSQGIGVSLEVGSLILIQVPYPGKYAEINSFSADNVNEGEPIHFHLDMDNLGSEDITPDSKVDVYSDGNLLDSYTFPTKTIATNTVESFDITSDKEYKSGSYEAFLTVDLKDENNKSNVIKDNVTFNVGSLSLHILDYTREANKSKINPYTIKIESTWNNDLKSVYAEVNVTKDNKQADFFKTPSVDLKKWEKADLQGFFNAENLEAGKYNANITLYYEDKSLSKMTDLQVYDPEVPRTNTTMLVIVGMIIGNILLVIIIIVVYVIIKRRKNARKNKFKKRQ